MRRRAGAAVLAEAETGRWGGGRIEWRGRGGAGSFDRVQDGTEVFDFGWAMGRRRSWGDWGGMGGQIEEELMGWRRRQRGWGFVLGDGGSGDAVWRS